MYFQGYNVSYHSYRFIKVRRLINRYRMCSEQLRIYCMPFGAAMNSMHAQGAAFNWLLFMHAPGADVHLLASRLFLYNKPFKYFQLVLYTKQTTTQNKNLHLTAQ